MQRLQQLVLSYDFGAKAAAHLPNLPPGLTQFGLTGQRQGTPYHAMSLLQLPQLQQLRLLKLCRIEFDEAVLCATTQLKLLQLEQCAISAAPLSSLTQLQQLTLRKCTLAAPAQSSDSDSESDSELLPPAAAAAGPTSLLAAIGQLTQLQVLELVSIEDGDDKLPARAFTALIASSQLQRLQVDGYNNRTLPRDAFMWMFYGRQLPQLQLLDLSHSDHDFYHKSSWCLKGKDLRRIAAACPGLTSLATQGLVRPGADTSALLRLRHCSNLSVGEWAFDNSAAAVVAGMTQLTSLRWWCARGFNGCGLQQLTALTRLQEVVFAPVFQKVPEHVRTAVAYSRDYAEGPCEHDYDLEPASEMESDLLCLFGLSSTEQRQVALASHGQRVVGSVTTDWRLWPKGQPVWRQLQELCERSPWMAPARIQQLAADNQQLQHTVEQQLMQIKQQQDTNSQLMDAILKIQQLAGGF